MFFFPSVRPLHETLGTFRNVKSLLQLWWWSPREPMCFEAVGITLSRKLNELYVHVHVCLRNLPLTAQLTSEYLISDLPSICPSNLRFALVPHIFVYFRPARPVPPRPSRPPATHTQLTHTHNLSTHNFLTYNLSTHNLSTHNLSTHNFLTHNFLTHTNYSHNFLTHNFLTHILLTQLVPTFLTHKLLTQLQLVHTQLVHI